MPAPMWCISSSNFASSRTFRSAPQRAEASRLSTPSPTPFSTAFFPSHVQRVYPRAAAPNDSAAAEPVETVAASPAPNAGVPQYPPQYRQDYYSQVPQYPTPPPGYYAAPAKDGWPPYIWVGIGALIALVGSKIFEFVRGGPAAMQQKAANAMMEQMMKQMGGGAGMPGGMPGMGAGFPPPPGGFQMPPNPPPAAGWSPPSTVDVKPDTPPPAAKDPAAPSEPFGATTPDKKDPAVTEVKAEPVQANTSSSFFKDYDEQAATSPNTSSQDAAGKASASGTSTPPGGGTPPEGGGTIDMLEKMMRDPEMQKTLYPYLPEPMRNPETMEWMLSQPEYRKQMEQMMGQMPGGPGGMPSMPDLNSPEMKAQFDQLGMSPTDIVQKIMSDPELASAFQDPKIQQAVMELSNNPMAMTKYQNDPEVMKVLNKMMEVFPQAGMPGGGMPK